MELILRERVNVVCVERVWGGILWHVRRAIVFDEPVSFRRTGRNLLCSVGISSPQLVSEDAKGVGGLQLTLPDRSSEDVRNLSRPAITI